MSLIDKEVIEFACYVSGKSAEEVEVLLEEWKNRDKVPDWMIKTRPTSEKVSNEARYRFLIEKLQDPDLTAGEFVELHTELQNIEYELENKTK